MNTLNKYTPAEQASIAISKNGLKSDTLYLLRSAVGDQFTGADKTILDASTKTPIRDLCDNDLTRSLATTFYYVSIDIGYQIQNKEHWHYMMTRIAGVLKQYYAELTMSDIKSAFELMSIGELDDYLPHDYLGNAQKSHYQRMSIEYITRILNAYRKRRSSVIAAAVDKLPPVVAERDEDALNRAFLAQQRRRNRGIYLEYKYTGRFAPDITDDLFLCDSLISLGLIDDIAITDEDRKKAVGIFISRATSGLCKDFQVSVTRARGKDSPYIETDAFAVAKKRLILEAFDYAIINELQLWQ